MLNTEFGRLLECCRKIEDEMGQQVSAGQNRIKHTLAPQPMQRDPHVPDPDKTILLSLTPN